MFVYTYTADGQMLLNVVTADLNGENRVLEYYPPNDKGLISDYSTILNYALIDKSDFWQGVPNYENIDYIG